MKGARLVAVGALAVLTAVLLVAGHRLFRFLCDDAYIAFRYVSNSQLGHGYVWNAPPFAPVEGYTSFLWVVVLDGLWSLTGLDPTVVADPLSLALAFGATALVGLWAWRLPLSGGLARHRVLVLGAVWLGMVTNRTWLTWTSSGLETALFNLELLGWIAVVALVRRSVGAFAALFGLASLLTLTRPDGLLFLLATTAAFGLWAVARRRQLPWTAALVPLPILAPLAHLAWRYATYGAWLPNTYYAKHVSPWPLAGLLYATSYLLEYAAWLPLGLVAAAAVRAVRGLRWTALGLEDVALAGLVAAPVAHLAYYTLNVGGDHFEYRIYVHLVPLGFLGAAWALDRLTRHPGVAVSGLVLAVVASWPTAWGHWWLASQLETRQETRQLTVDLAAHAPLPVHGYALAFDLVQQYLSTRHVGTRHREHVVFARTLRERYPSREEGLRIGPEALPVHEAWSVGIPAWTLPHVAIVDKLGLNDRVVARNPVSRRRMRMMGHDRRPPRGYVECFRPNVDVGGGRARLRPRETPLTPDDVAACEARFWDVVHRITR
jgi:arabinofuranosyltransferase